MISFPYDNKSETVQDRNIDSDTYAKYMDRMVGTNGIFLELGTKLEVTAGEGMTVLVKPGDGIITGHFFIEEDTRELQVQASESLDRIDTVVLRHDAEKRMIDLYVVKGTSATVPQPPELTREAGIYELGIANVYVPKLTNSITQERITDTRLNTERCGVAPVLGGIDTQGLYDQYQASLDAFLELVDTAIDGTTVGYLEDLIKAPIGDKRYIASPMVYGDWGNWYNPLPNGGYLVLSTFQFSKSQPYMLTVSIGNDRVSQAEYRILVHFQEHPSLGLVIDPRFNINCLTSRLEHANYNDYSLDYTQIPIHFLKDAEGDGHIAFGDGTQKWMNTQVRILDVSLYGTVDDENWKQDFRNDWGLTCLADLDDFTVLKTVQPEDIHFIDVDLRKEVTISEETMAAFEAIGWTPPAEGAVIESLLDWMSEHAEFYKEKGTSGNWIWKEDADGNIEAYAKISNNVNINSGNAPVYYNNTDVKIAIPEFIAAEYVSIEWKDGGGGLIFPYARIVGQNVQVTYFRFYGGPANLTMTYRIKIKGIRKT